MYAVPLLQLVTLNALPDIVHPDFGKRFDELLDVQFAVLERVMIFDVVVNP